MVMQQTLKSFHYGEKKAWHVLAFCACHGD